MTFLEAVLMTVITASTPLLIAAVGELVTERAGVLNLGVEGMMIMGAATGFATAYLTGSTLLGLLVAIVAGMALAALFGALTIGLGANQVASGLALTILGLGLSGLIGAPLIGAKRETLAPLSIPGLSDLPFIGPLLFGQNVLVYAAFVLVLAVGWFLFHSRAGLLLRAIGDNPASAHALGHPVRRIRFLATLFGGGCAGLAGAYISLAYTPFWTQGMTAGRGWIALAIVVFSSWLPGRALIGAYLFGGVTILQLHAQGAGIGIPAQLMSALPYLVTVVALVLISRGGQEGSSAPASLGIAFIPER